MDQPILFYTEVARCASCKVWYTRYPIFAGLGDKGDQCHKCGCTSFSISPGRPIGPKSQHWEWVLNMWNEITEFCFRGNETDSMYEQWLLASVALPSNFACKTTQRESTPARNAHVRQLKQ